MMTTHRTALEPPREWSDALRELAEPLGIGCWHFMGVSECGTQSFEGGYLHIDVPLEGGLPALLKSVHPEDRENLAAAAHRAHQSGGTMVCSFRTMDLRTRFLRIAARVHAAGGHLILASGFLLDETPEVAAAARLASIAETTPALLWVMEPNGFCSFFSRSWYEYTGQTPEQALGRGWLDRVHPEDIEMAAECARRAVELKTFFRIEHRLLHRDGAWRWVLCIGNPRIDSAGRFLGHSGAVTDIHERRIWEQRLQARVGLMGT